MKHHYRRSISFVVSLLTLGLALASNTIPAQAAVKYVVDDDRKQCKTADFTDIGSALIQLGSKSGTIEVCAGTYSGPIDIFSANGLKLEGMKGAVIVPPAISPYNGTLLNVTSSHNVTIEGFTFDGQGKITTTTFNGALQFGQSSGIIQKNIFRNWHAAGYGPVGGTGLMSIYLHDGTGQAVKITGNTINSFEDTGIDIDGVWNVSITNNTISTTTSGSSETPTGIYLQPTLTGAPHGIITGNKLTSDAFPGISSEANAIFLNEVGHFTISSNTVTGWGTAVFSQMTCAITSQANNTLIKNNKFQKVYDGIDLFSMTPGTCDTHADHIQITGNKVVDAGSIGHEGIYVGGCGGVNCPGPGQANELSEVVKNNTVTHFTKPIVIDHEPNLNLTGTFAPNHIHP